ncbi:hypothetical protein [Weissella cibaria]|uniref:hypothetical protein n=1 Tax=Weissella cibaria TaxID=137591 RepID=UPI0007A6067D|nr:hypothetical protein [Weissella cibaria]MCT0021086.1 hypothetical protein [Weissella cibaria]QDG80220.1 hypothetical protein Wei3612_02015 [Weissella cibaria]QMU87589.1 hypothetical protein H3N00_06165 [Weissella cibaria]TVV35947.1 hypothetical protein FO439_04805 [Weissella cibaria]UNW39842.1 hypothetical protein HUW87_06060 [Weissella cibaria]
MQDEQQVIEFWGPELLKAAVFDGISLTDGTFMTDASRRLVFIGSSDSAVAMTEAVDPATNAHPLLVKQFPVTNKTLSVLRMAFPGYDVLLTDGVYRLDWRPTWGHPTIRQSYIADFKDAFEYEVGHQQFASYLRDATIRYAEEG